MKKGRIIATSIASIAMCASLIAGGTYALFTSESTVNIAVTSGKVDVEATIGELTLSSTVKGVTTPGENGQWVNGGTATVSDATITLDKMTPGDTVSFDITVTNHSDVAVQARTIYLAEGELLGGLTIDGFGEVQQTGVTLWRMLEVGSKAEVYSVSITLDEDAGNEYQEKSAAITFGVEAVQGNAQVDDPFTVRYGETEEKFVSFAKALDCYEQADAKDVTIDIAQGTYYNKNVVVEQIENKNLTIRADKDATFVNNSENPVFVVDGNSRYSAETLTFDGLDFELNNSAIGVQFGSGSALRYAHNVTVQNCSFIGADNTACAVQSGSGSNGKGITVSDCTAEGIKSLVSIYSSDLTVSGCTATNINSFVNNQPAGATTSVVGCNATVNGNEASYGVRVNGGNLTVSNSTLTLESKAAFTTGAIVVRGATNVTLENNIISATVAQGVNGAAATVCQQANGQATVTSDKAYTLLTGYKSESGFAPMAWYNETGVKEKDGYAIFNADGVIAFRNACANNANLSTTIILTADIDMEGRTWATISRAHYEWGTKLAGMVFDGKGHTISNMKITGSGMFDLLCIDGLVTFKNLTMDNVQAIEPAVYGGNQFKAVFVGHAYSDVAFDNVTVSNSKISGYWAIGAFVGMAGNENAVDLSFNNCHVVNFTIDAPWNYYTSAFVGCVWDYDTGADIITFTGSNTVLNFTVNAVNGGGNNTAGSIHTDVSELENVIVSGYQVIFH